MTSSLSKNLDNLNAFWMALNAKEVAGVASHATWPNKVWRNNFSFLNNGSNLPQLSSKNAFVTAEDINIEQFDSLTIKTQLVIMNLSLEKGIKSNDSTDKLDPKIIAIADEDSAIRWTKACSQAFGYDIDSQVIQKLLHDNNAKIFAYMLDGRVAGTAIGYITGDTLGIHQLGIVPDFRKRGIAGALMNHLLAYAQINGQAVVSLQASQAALHLYQQLGFKTLGKLTSLVRKQ